MLGAMIVGGLGFRLVLTCEPSVPVTDIAAKSEMPLASLVKDKGHVVFPLALDHFEESVTEPPFTLAWRSRPYA